jgi:hypothetical protein
VSATTVFAEFLFPLGLALYAGYGAMQALISGKVRYRRTEFERPSGWYWGMTLSLCLVPPLLIAVLLSKHL